MRKDTSAMKEFFADILRYHHHYNQKFVDFLEEIPHDPFEYSIRLLSHMVNAHQIWNARILDAMPLAVHELHHPEKIKQIDRQNYYYSLKILAEKTPELQISYQNSKGEEFQNTVQQIFYHLTNHHTHHRAQIVSELRRNGIEPLVTDYIFYKRNK